MNKKYLFIIISLSVLIVLLAGGSYYLIKQATKPTPPDNSSINGNSKAEGELVINIAQLETVGEDNQVSYLDVWIDSGISLSQGEVGYVYSEMAERIYRIDNDGNQTSFKVPKLVSITATEDKIAVAGVDKSVAVISEAGEILYYEFIKESPISMIFQDNDILLVAAEKNSQESVIFKISISQGKVIDTINFTERIIKLRKYNNNIYYLSPTGVYSLDGNLQYEVKNALDFLILADDNFIAITAPKENMVLVHGANNQVQEWEGIFLSVYEFPKEGYFLVSSYKEDQDKKHILSVYLLKGGNTIENIWDFSTVTNVLRGETIGVMQNGEIIISTRETKDVATGNYIWILQGFRMNQAEQIEQIGDYSVASLPVLSLFPWGEYIGVGTTKSRVFRVSIESFE